MRLSKVLLTCAAASMVAMPVAASAAAKANPAAKLSLSKAVPGSARASSKSGKSKQSETGIIVLVAAAGAVVAGTLAATSGDSKSDSN